MGTSLASAGYPLHGSVPAKTVAVSTMGHATRNRRNRRGLLTEPINAMGHMVRFQYDAAHAPCPTAQ